MAAHLREERSGCHLWAARPRMMAPMATKAAAGTWGLAITSPVQRSRSTPTKGWVSPPHTHTCTHTHTHAHTHTTTTACVAMLCGPGVHVCCLRAAGVLCVCVEVLWTLGVGMQEHMTTPSIHPTNTHTHNISSKRGRACMSKTFAGLIARVLPGTQNVS